MPASLLPPMRVERETPSPRARFRTPWIQFAPGLEVLRAMKELLERDSEGRATGIAISANPNAGKSHLLDFFADSYPDLEEAEPAIQVLYAETPVKADGAALLRELLRQMGARFNTRSPIDVLIHKFCVRAAALRIRLILIDELTNGNWGRHEAAVTLLQAVRSILNRTGRPVVVAGTTKLKDLLRNDEQLSERFRRMDLPAWTEMQPLANFIATFEPALGMAQPSGLATEEMTLRILELSRGGSTGRIAILLKTAAAIAKKANRPTITSNDIETAGTLMVGYPET